MAGLKRIFEDTSIHCEVAIASEEDCVAYVTKEDTRVDGPWFVGTQHKGAGARTDIHYLAEAVRGGKRGREIYDDDNLVSAAVKYAGGLRAMVAAYDPPRVLRPAVLTRLCIGPSGSGKSWCCANYAASKGTAVYTRPKGVYWERYAGETTCILEEFGDSFMDIGEWKRLCDKYVLQIHYVYTSILSNFTLTDSHLQFLSSMGVHSAALTLCSSTLTSPQSTGGTLRWLQTTLESPYSGE